MDGFSPIKRESRKPGGQPVFRALPKRKDQGKGIVISTKRYTPFDSRGPGSDDRDFGRDKEYEGFSIEDS